MTLLSRRSFLSSAGALPFCVWFEQHAKAQTTFTRHEAWSTEGQAMLKTYAVAVDKMMHSVAEGDPTGWLFQWYMHSVGFVRPAETADGKKDAEIMRVYPTAGPRRDLAQETWNTCRPHFRSADQPYFLPWHRMYVYFFERIVRKVSGDATFALPYWNYSTSDASKHGIIPPQFRKPTDPVFKSLYRGNRNKPALGPNTPDVNKGEPIDKYASGDLDLSALKQGNYLPALPLEGFNMALDKHLHGNVHGDTGDDHNMGAVPWAARDPIFWLHHGNIDRLWASWNQAGGLNPSGSWLDQQFTFADENGTRVLAKVADFKDIGPLQYRYDRLESPPPVFKAFTGAASDINRTSAVAYTLKTPVNLGPRPVRAALQPVAAAAGKAFSTNAVTLVESRRVYLVIKRIETDIPPRVPFNLYLNAPEGSAAPPQVHLAGRVSFFGVAHQGHDAAAADTPNDFVSFDVTEVIRGLIARNLLSETPTVTIAPVGRPAGNAKPVIGEISIVQL